jgi:hypothetical protein
MWFPDLACAGREKNKNNRLKRLIYTWRSGVKPSGGQATRPWAEMHTGFQPGAHRQSQGLRLFRKC